MLSENLVLLISGSVRNLHVLEIRVHYGNVLNAFT